MKVAISSTGNLPEALVDERFGRCAYFVIYDTETRQSQMLENPYRNASQGVGPSAVTLVASLGVEKIVSGEFGVKIRSMLDDLKIQMIVIKEPKTIQEIIELLNH